MSDLLASWRAFTRNESASSRAQTHFKGRLGVISALAHSGVGRVWSIGIRRRKLVRKIEPWGEPVDLSRVRPKREQGFPPALGDSRAYPFQHLFCLLTIEAKLAGPG
jgi:hypothetical protein